MLNLVKKSRWLIAIIVVIAASQAFGHGMSEEEKQSILDGGNLSYLWLGATHMLTGYDHLAFVFGIIFFLTKFKDIVKYITAFTLGHSVTLISATFIGLQVNYFLIDAVIALSVCYIAFVNLDGFKKYLNIEAPNMLIMITGLGLIHGLGLSTRLQMLPLSEDQLLMNIISFNVGVELGQTSALALMLLVISGFRKSRFFPPFSLIVNYALVFLGVSLFFLQMHGYEHSVNSEDYVPQVQTIQQQETPQESDWKTTVSITLAAGKSKEYKLKLEKGAKIEYLWQTDGSEVFFDFHGEPFGDKTGYFESFKKGNESKSGGPFTSTFKGTHGWYWKNKTSAPVTITLKTKGEYPGY